MSKSLFICIFLIITKVNVFSQNIDVLNGFKYVFLAPLAYKDGSLDKFGIRYQIKEKLQSLGFEIVQSPTVLQGAEVCLIVNCFITHTDNFYQPVPDRVYITFNNCGNETVFTLEGASNSSMPRYTPEKGLAQATMRAWNKLGDYRYKFDASKTMLNNLPKLELTGLTEDSMKVYLTSSKLDPIEGIYKTYHVNKDDPYYKIGIIKSGDIFKAIIIECEFSHWKPGEVKATFEQSSMKGFYSVKWYMGNKKPFETFGGMDNNAVLTIEFKDFGTDKKTEQKFVKMFPSISKDVPFKKSDFTASGSGFFLTTDGIIATNAHVIENAENMEVSVSNEIGTFNYKAKTLLIDPKNDVALIKIDDKKFQGLSTIPYGITDKADAGESVFTIGYPLNDIMGTNYKVSDGIISAKSGIADDVRYYQISVPLQPGNSGGPLFDKQGNIIGITSSKLNGKAIGMDIQNVNYAIKCSYLINLYQMLPHPPKLNTTSQVNIKSLQDQVKIFKNYVCLIKVF